jgi:hypothetical protein
MPPEHGWTGIFTDRLELWARQLWCCETVCLNKAGKAASPDQHPQAPVVASETIRPPTVTVIVPLYQQASAPEPVARSEISTTVESPTHRSRYRAFFRQIGFAGFPCRRNVTRRPLSATKPTVRSWRVAKIVVAPLIGSR